MKALMTRPLQAGFSAKSLPDPTAARYDEWASSSRPDTVVLQKDSLVLDTRPSRDAMSDFRVGYRAVVSRPGHPRSAGRGQSTQLDPVV
jgi:hypothetical protein